MDTMNLIIPQIFLGGINAAKNSDRLKKVGINSILTIDMNPLPPQYTDEFKYKFIKALDSPTQNLFCYFDECYEFIEETYNSGQAIIIHCYVGVSRSSTILLSYLMRKYGISLSESITKVNAKRLISPNSGFMDQLRLYESLGCRIDATDPSYRAYKLNQFAKNMIETFTSFSKEDIPLAMLATDPTNGERESQKLTANERGAPSNATPVYKCKNCRRDLFFSDSLLTHVKGLGYLAYRSRAYKTTKADDATVQREHDPDLAPAGLRSQNGDDHGELQNGDRFDDSNVCKDYLFIEPVTWMREEITGVQGKLHCPKCSSKLGSFNWAGERCGCQTWITPAFNIQRSKVDLSDATMALLNVPYIDNPTPNDN